MKSFEMMNQKEKELFWKLILKTKNKLENYEIWTKIIWDKYYFLCFVSFICLLFFSAFSWKIFSDYLLYLIIWYLHFLLFFYILKYIFNSKIKNKEWIDNFLKNIEDYSLSDLFVFENHYYENWNWYLEIACWNLVIFKLESNINKFKFQKMSFEEKLNYFLNIDDKEFKNMFSSEEIENWNKKSIYRSLFEFLNFLFTFLLILLSYLYF